jgi:uncharacterized membrane protein
VHGGGFYHPVKYAVAPPQLPPHLHWFYWEAYSTWLSGFALFTVSYLWNAGTYLVDKSLMNWSPGAAGRRGAVLPGGLLDPVRRDLPGLRPRKNGDAIVGALVAVLVCVAAWLACHWFAGRAAFLLVGAMIATAMSANVFFWIIPGQRKVVAASRPASRSTPSTAGAASSAACTTPTSRCRCCSRCCRTTTASSTRTSLNWLVLMLMMFAGAAIRQFFVMRHGWKLGRNRHPAGYALVGVAVIAATDRVAEARHQRAAKAPAAARQLRATVQKVLEQRCYQCHGAQVQMKNVRLDSPEA